MEDFLIEREQLLDEIDQLKEKLENAVSYQIDLEKKNSESRLKINELVDNFEIQVNELDCVKEHKYMLDEDLKAIKKELEKYKNDLSNEQEIVEKYQIRSVQLESALENQHKINEKLTIEIETQQKQIRNLRNSFDKVSNDNKQLQCEISSQSKKIKNIEESNSKLCKEYNDIEKVKKLQEAKILLLEKVKAELESQKLENCGKINNFSKELDRKQKELDKMQIKVNDFIKDYETSQLKIANLKDLLKVQEDTIKANNTKIKDQQNINDRNKIDMKKLKKSINSLKNDKNHLIEESIVLKSEIDQAVKEMKLRQNDIMEMKRKIEKAENQLIQKQSLFEDIRMEKIQLEKEFQITSTENSDLRTKFKNLNVQLDQLKENIIAKENALIRNENIKNQLLRNEENLKTTIQNELENSKQLKNDIDQLKFNNHQLEKQLDENRAEMSKKLATINQILHEKEIINRKLIESKENNQEANGKICTLLIELNQEKLNNQKLTDEMKSIRIKNSEILAHNETLKRSTELVTVLKQEIIALQRNLVDSNSKNQVLENELIQPTNVHRWRFLKSTNTKDLEQLENYQQLQKKCIQLSGKVIILNKKLKRLQNENQNSKILIEKISQQKPQCEIFELKKTIKCRNENIQNLLTNLKVHEKESTYLKEKLNNLQTIVRQLVNDSNSK